MIKKKSLNNQKNLNFKMKTPLILIIIFILFSLIYISEADAIEIGRNFTIRGQVINSSGQLQANTAYTFQFNITNNNACTNALYSNTSQSLTTDSRGIFVYNLTNVALDYSNQLYLCYFRYDGNTLLKSEFLEISPSLYSILAKNLSYNVLTTQHLQANSINTSSIIDRAVTAIKILLNSITADHLTANSVNGSHIVDNSINGTDLMYRSVNSSHIINLSCSQIFGNDADFCNDATGAGPVNISYINNTETWTANKTVLSLIPAFNVTNGTSGVATNRTADLGNSTNFWNWGYIYNLFVNNIVNKIDFNNLATSVTQWLYNQTSNYLQINQSTVSGLNNESGSYAPIRFGYNMSNYSSQELHPSFSRFWINQTPNYLQINTSTLAGITNESASYASVRFGINETTAISTIANTWTQVQTYNQNITLSGGNLSFIFVNTGITYAGGNATEFWNGTCLIKIVRTLRDEWCP